MTRMLRALQRGVDSVAKAVNSFDVRDLAAYVTLAALLLIAHNRLELLLVTICVILVVAFQRVRRGPWIWLGVAVAWMPNLILNWQHQEDHTYLAAYWCLALGLAFLGKRPRAVIAANGRVLIGLVFAFAVLWKIVTPAFVDSSLFHYKLLLDYRFRDMVTAPVAGLTPEETEQNLHAIVALQEPMSQETIARMHYPPSMPWLAHGMTWWTIVAEGALAIMFLIPSGWLSRLRNAALCLFMLCTYTIVPVLGFGMLFASMGLAQTRASERRSRLAYLLTALILTVWFYR